MSAKLRFHMMVKHSGCIYNAADSVRTVRLMEALDDIAEKINPAGSEQWRMVENDARRILNIWLSREQTTAASVMARELLDSLHELAGAAVVVVAPAAAPVALPHLEIVDKAPAPAPVLHPTPVPESDEEEEDDEEDDAGQIGEDDEDEEEEDDDQALGGNNEEEEEEEEDADEEEEEEKVVVQKLPAPEPEPEVEGSADGEDDEEAADNDEEGDTNNEIVEPAADEENADEEEEGMEVEKRTIRGRDYWLDVNTNKLYAVVDDDDVGDEVGAIVNGRPVFTA